MNLLPPTIQEIKIPTHPALRLNQNHPITLLVKSAAIVERTDDLYATALTEMGFTNLYIKLMSLKIPSKNIQEILELVCP